MKFNYILPTALFLVCLIACDNSTSYVPAGLNKLSNEKLLDRARNHQFPSLENVTFKKEDGSPVTIEELQNDYAEDEWAMDYYINDQGAIKEMVLRKATQVDLDLRIQLKEAIDEGPPLKAIQIDCSDIKNILQNVFDSDQETRKEGSGIDLNVDRKNLEIVISLLDQCGMPKLSEVGEIPMTAIWLAFQHSNNIYRKKYFSNLKEAAANGDLEISKIAMMEDRILMDDSKPQKYGTQISKNVATGKWELYDLEDPANVDTRRSKLGMGNLQTYLSKWDIKFNPDSTDN